MSHLHVHSGCMALAHLKNMRIQSISVGNVDCCWRLM